jgi:hypothetical protein
MSTCRSCASQDVVGFTLAPSGEPLRFTHCRNCEHHWWQAASDDGGLALVEVLERIGVPA